MTYGTIDHYLLPLESDIEPFKGLLLGIFFIAIGASLNFTLIGEKILLIAGITAALIGFKWFVLVITGFIFKIAKKERSLFAIALAQGGEFAFGNVASEPPSRRVREGAGHQRINS